MLNRSPMFASLTAPRFGFGMSQGRGNRLPFIVEPSAAGRAVPASARQPLVAPAKPVSIAPQASTQMPAFEVPKLPTGTYKLKPQTHGQLVSAVARAKDPLSNMPHGQAVSAVAQQKPAAGVDPNAAAQAALMADKKRRQQAAQMGILRNQAINKPPVLSAPSTATAAMPSTLPSATRASMANNRIR